MIGTRLDVALSRGHLSVPEEGRLAVWGPRAGDDLSALPPGRTDVIQRNYPDHAHFAALGYTARTAPEGPYALSVICLPRAKAEGRGMLVAAAGATDGPLVLDGAKTDGIDALVKDLRKRATLGEVLSKAHGKLVVLTDLDTEGLAPASAAADGFATAPGAFSADAVDPGSRALAEALPEKMSGHVVDLGAGWGYLARQVLDRDVTRVDLVEADHAALDAARINVTDPRAAFHWADARDWRPDAPVDAVITNPPFHQGRRADVSLGQSFIAAAAAMLSPRGTLWLVANRHLPYERALAELFGEVTEHGQNPSYKIFAATRPRRGKKG